MKYTKQLLVISILLILSVQTAYAQVALTILPGTDKGEEECMQYLNEYEIKGEIPKNVNDETEAQYYEASSKFDEAEEKLEAAKQANDQSAITQAQKEYDEASSAYNNASEAVEKSPDDLGSLLGCAIKTGRISLSMIPYFITYIINFLLGLSGIIATLFVVVGGYYYIYGGLTDQKEKGKKTIVNALWGMSLAIISWIIIQIILRALTS